MKKPAWISLCLFFTLLLNAGIADAQDAPAQGPVYIVQAGDTLWGIAQRFGVSTDELVAANQIANPNLLSAGDELVIPGLQGVQGTLITVTVPYGESLRSLSRRFQTPVPLLARLNRLVSSEELYAGSNLIVSDSVSPENSGKRASLKPGQSLLELAVIEGSDPWTVAATNALSRTWQAVPGEVYQLPGPLQEGPGALPPEVINVEVNALPLVQGKTLVIKVGMQGEVFLGGTLLDRNLNFFRDGVGNSVALQGIHAMTQPGFYPLSITGELEDGSQFSFSQLVYLRDGGYPFDPVLTVDPTTLDPAVTQPEDLQWSSLVLPVTERKRWEGRFAVPVDSLFADCFPSRFGYRRAYNDGPYNYFHTGLDFCGSTGNEIYSPAQGEVIFGGPLAVRGNAAIIDHGWGVYTGYMHMSEILVEAGDMVDVGQLIGRVGSTGRVTGPHLHWEVFVGGVQVDPLDWLEQEFP